MTLPEILNDWHDASYIIEAMGKPYAPAPVPNGMPRYRAAGCCHYNSWRACTADPRLHYVEGLARVPGINGDWLVGHAWVTLDGVHAIDLTWRGARKRAHASRSLDAATEYYGVEIPHADVTRLYVENGGPYLCLADWYRSEAA